jgi:hypothetical protein
MIKKTIQPTGDMCIKFTDEELVKLNIKENDKFSIQETEDGFLLQKFDTISLEIDEFPKHILISLIKESCEKDISVNEVFSNILENFIKNEKKT